MSYGSISQEAHEDSRHRDESHRRQVDSRAKAAKIPKRFKPYGKWRQQAFNSKIKQVASGRFGVTAEYLANSDET
jgi:glutamate synthase (NADPH/NADH) large chain